MKDAFDKFENNVNQIQRKARLLERGIDSGEQKQIKRAMRETIKLISEIGKNPVVTRHTDKTFKKELGRATTAMLEFMQNKAGIDENTVVQRMEDLRDLMDDSLFHKGNLAFQGQLL